MKNTIDVLLVEDSPADARFTEEILKETDLDVHLTTMPDGEQAMDYLNTISASGEYPDVILLDLNMPKKNGHEVLAEMKADGKFQNIPVVVLTVSQEDDEILDALNTRMNYYLNKPVTPDSLERLLRTIHDLWSDSGDN